MTGAPAPGSAGPSRTKRAKKPKEVCAYGHRVAPRILPAHLTDTNIDCVCTRLEVFAVRPDTAPAIASDLHQLLASRHDWRLKALANDDRADRNYAAGRRDERRRQETERSAEWRAAFLVAAREAELLPPPADAVGQSHREVTPEGGEAWAGGATRSMMARAKAWIAATSPWDDAPYEGGFEQLRQDFRGFMLEVERLTALAHPNHRRAA